MRIQHNITAMNAYRNYNNNTSKVGKNLEKLSSGYRINRAGDDAAGLAVSQKMRLQISGLAQAQKNAKSGISYVQTAEGALTEVHDMLERMYTLAEQSANGTFDDSTDRVQLQKEMDKLSEEINRIGQTANFNGQGIFAEYVGGNGAVGGTSSSGSSGGTKLPPLKTISASVFDSTKSGALKTQAEQEAGSKVTACVGNKAGATLALSSVGKLDVTVKMSDGTSYAITLLGSSDDGHLSAVLNGKSYDITGGMAGGSLSNVAVGCAVAAALSGLDSFSSKATITAGAGGVILATSLNKGTETPYITQIDVSDGNKTYTDKAKDSDIQYGVGKDSKKLKLSDIGTYDGNGTAKNFVFEIGGEKFAIVKNETAAGLLAKDPDCGDVTAIVYASLSSAKGSVLEEEVVSKIEEKLGVDFLDLKGNDDELILVAREASKTSGGGAGGGGNGGGVSFWIGAENIATSDGVAVNKLTLDAMKLSTSAMGVEGSSVAMGDVSTVDIKTADNAMAALTAIKSASDAVSDMRGTLGAMQNRLDHTINNLSVMQENMQDAESVIRDTDVADEMMAYTKNNILIQSAQAMLAQANQLPQGVLQLLQ